MAAIPRQHLVVAVRFIFWLGRVRYTSCVKFNDGGDNEDGDDSLKVIKKTRPWKVIISFFIRLLFSLSLAPATLVYTIFQLSLASISKKVVSVMVIFFYYFAA